MISEHREKIKKFDGIWRNNGMEEEWKNARRRQNTEVRRQEKGNTGRRESLKSFKSFKRERGKTRSPPPSPKAFDFARSTDSTHSTSSGQAGPPQAGSGLRRENSAGQGRYEMRAECLYRQSNAAQYLFIRYFTYFAISRSGLGPST
jgi:hypothetical protein